MNQLDLTEYKQERRRQARHLVVMARSRLAAERGRYALTANGLNRIRLVRALANVEIAMAQSDVLENDR